MTPYKGLKQRLCPAAPKSGGMSQDGTGTTEVDDPNGDIIVDDIPAVKAVARKLYRRQWRRRR